MRLGVNARRLAGQPLGVARYIEYLARYWNEQVAPSDTVELFLREPAQHGELALPERIRTTLLRPRLHGVAWEDLVLARAARDVDVLFCPSYTAPRTHRGRCVLAIHSTNEVTAGAHRWSYRFTYAALYAMSARRADRVIVPSEVTRNDVERLYGIPRERIDVIPQGADDAFRPLHDESRARVVRERYFGADDPFILWVGKLSQRRNIPLLIEAFGLLKRQDGIPHRLLLCGPNHLKLPIDDLARKLGIHESVVQTDGRFTGHEALVEIYNAADAYVNVSLYEGFSLTLVEALACGTPVVAVRRGALSEIAGDAAQFVEEPTVEHVADGIRRVLRDGALSAELRARGPERARQFRWVDTAQRTLDVLRALATA